MSSPIELNQFSQSESFNDIKPVSRATALICLGNAAYTLFATPDHDKLHRDVEAIGSTQPRQPSPKTTIDLLKSQVLPVVDTERPVQLDGARQLQLAGVLIQFTDYTPRLQGDVEVPYDSVLSLHEEIRREAKNDGPLGFAQQLEVALAQSDNDITEALWNLFITSRMYARWLDSRVIKNIPNYTREEKIQMMLNWRESITACKPPSEGDRPQDPAGDAYYTWTHALAKYAFSLSSPRETLLNRTAVQAFHRGTDIMHTVVHSINKQAVNSNHALAAEYGNGIGQACVDHIKTTQTVI